MKFTLAKIVPWGRSFKEYKAMFSLSSADLKGSILDCGGGPASFNAEHTACGGRVMSIDPLYGFGSEEIKNRIDTCFDEVVRETERNGEQFVWQTFRTIQDLALARRTAMDRFIEDYKQDNSRYVSGELPSLPFENKTFDLALCSHLLFLYSDHLDIEFHVKSMKELCRVANEVRVFPLLDLSATRSSHVDAVCEQLVEGGFRIALEKVNYEFQKGGFEMLRVKPNPESERSE